MSSDEQNRSTPQGDPAGNEADHVAPGERMPDRTDTGGGPRGGNTLDGRTGPGGSMPEGPKSTLGVEHDFSGDGNLGYIGGDDELTPTTDITSATNEQSEKDQG